MTKTKLAEKFRADGQTEYDKIIQQIERLSTDCKNIFWYDPIPYADRKKLIKEGFTITDGDGFIQIKW